MVSFPHFFRMCSYSFCIFALLLCTGCKESKEPTNSGAGVKTDQDGLRVAPTVSHDPKYQMSSSELNKLSRTVNKNIKTMDLNELAQAKRYALGCGDKELATNIVERQLGLETDHARQATLRLERADLYFETGKFEKAGRMYRELNELYPRGTAVDEIKYKEILCRFYQTLDSDRDQSKTRETLMLVSEYLSAPALYAQYVPDVTDIQVRCNKKLFEHELSVLNCYMAKGSYDAVHKRLAYMKEHFAQLDVADTLFALECKVLKNQGKLAQLATVKRQYAQGRGSDIIDVGKARVHYASRF